MRRFTKTLPSLLPALAATAACTALATAQTAWVGPGTDATNAANWSAGVPAGLGVTLDTNGNTAYALDLNGVAINGGGTTVSNEAYTIGNTGAAANWSGAFTVNSGASADVTNVALTGKVTVAGDLTVNDNTVLGSHAGIVLDGGTLNITEDITISSVIGVNQFVSPGGGTLNIAPGKTMTADRTGTNGQFTIGQFPIPPRIPNNLTLTGGGTLELINDMQLGATFFGGESFLFIEGNSTFRIGNFRENWVSGTFRPLRVASGSTVEVIGTPNQTQQAGNSTLGVFQPGSTLKMVSDRAHVWPGDAAALIWAGNSSAVNQHIVDVNPGAELWIGSNQTQGGLSTEYNGNPALTHDTNATNPVAYVKKIGAGEFAATRDHTGVQFNNPLKVVWELAEGTLAGGTRGVGGTVALGATAVDRHDWAPLRPTLEGKPFHFSHLEGITVRSGTTLEWAGLHGFFDNSWWIGTYPNEEGDGWLPNEFLIEGGSTLIGGENANKFTNFLTFGFTDLERSDDDPDIADPTVDVDDGVFHAYPTIDTTTSNDMTFGNTINFRSGIEVTGPDSLLDVTITGGTYSITGGGTAISKVRFSGNLIGQVQNINGGTISGAAIDVFQTLDVQSGSAVIYQNHANVTSTTVASGAILEFAPTGSISYSGSVASDGEVLVSSGTAAVEQITGTGTLTIDTGATLQLTGDTVGLSTASSATLDGTLDIDQSGIVLGGTDEATVQSQIVGGTIISTTADSVSTHAIGYGPSGSDTLIRYALTGDANLDNSVNIGDLTLLAGSFGGSGFWANGDFNHDGLVNIGDLTLLAGNFGDTFSATAVPEPTSLALLALGGLALIRRR